MDTTTPTEDGELETMLPGGGAPGSRTLVTGPPHDRAAILIVDDVPANLLALEGTLRRKDIEIITAGSGREALEVLLRRDVAAVILDVMMPEMDGFELADLIHGVDRTRHVPVIFVTAAAKTDYRVFTGYETGAIDFLFKPIDEHVLRAKVDVLIALQRQRREAERARAETAVLLHLAQTTSQAETPANVYGPVLDALEALLGAERSAILLFDETDRMRFRAWRGLSDAYRSAVDGHSPWSRDERNARPILIGDVTRDDSMAPYQSTFAAEGIGAIGFVPLDSRGLLGKLMLYWDQPRTFSDHDEALAIAIASQVAEALERAGLREAERRAHTRVSRLQRITAALNEVLTPEEVARACISAVSETMDLCAVSLYLLSADGSALELLDSAGVPAETREAFRRVPLDTRMASITAVASRQPVFFDSREEYLAAYPHLSSYPSRQGPPAAIPMFVGERVIGSFALVLPPSSRYPLPDEDRAFLLAAVGQCAQALDRARLHGEERVTRARMAFLAEASAELSKSLDYRATLHTVAKLAVPRLADWCVVDIAGDPGRSPTRLAVVHTDPARVELARELSLRYPADPDAPRGVPQVIRTGRSELYREISDELLVQGARDEDHLRIMRAVGMRSAMVVPIATGEGTLGAISFVAGETDRRYDEQDLAMAEEIGRRAGVAIENARLYEAERQARKEAQLAEERRAAIQLISDAALAHLEVAPLITEMLARVRRMFGCDTATILLLTADRKQLEVAACDGIEREAWHGVAVPYGAGFAGTIVAHARPLVVEDVAAADVVSGVIKDRLKSLAGVPLMLDGGALGVLHIGSFETRRFTDADIELLRMVAARIALAVDRANAHDALQQTLHYNEVFAGVLAHDLRNPLGAILGAARVLTNRYGEKVDERGQRSIRSITISAERIGRLIDQLLDFTRARVGGGFELRPADANLATICQQVLSEIQLAHPDWKVSVESAGEVGGYWDADRLLQVVSNLATNAGQHGTPGAPIRVKLDGTNAQLVALEIHNEGSISSDLLPNIFSPFKGTREFGSDGLGLGAFITREIVQAHGGTVDVRSSDDEGTTFTVRLPRRIVAPSS